MEINSFYRRAFILLFLLLFIIEIPKLLAVTKVDSTVTVDEVISNYIKSIGGREKLKNVTDKKTVLIGNVQGLELTLEIYQKTPNKYYQKMEAGELNQETWFNGEKGFQSTSGLIVPISGDQLAMIRIQAVLNPQLKFKQLEITPELSGLENVNGKDAFEVILNLPSGKQWLQYYDKETGYLVKQISSVDTEQGSSTVTSTYSDYREIDGIMYAHKITQSFGVQLFELTLKSCEVNTGIDDSKFEVD